MAKKRKTRSQKRTADHRHAITLKAPILSSKMPDSNSSERQQFTFVPKVDLATSSTPQPATGYEYIAKDLKKTLFTTGTIIVVQVVLAFFINFI